MARGLSWEVESVKTDQTINTPSNDTVVGAYVYFVTGEGNHGAVFLSNDKFNSANVTAAIHREAKKLDDISNLSHNMG